MHLNPGCTGMVNAAVCELCNLRKAGLCFDIARHLCLDVISNIDGELWTNPGVSGDEGLYQSPRRGITGRCLSKQSGQSAQCPPSP